jgi:hypothetical protein
MAEQSKAWWRPFAPERLLDRMERRRIEREIDAINAKFQPMLDAAKDAGEESHIVQAWHYETEEWDEELGRLLSKRVEKQARWWGVDIPEDHWTESRYEGYRYIGYGAQTKLRRAIRDARRDSARFWVQVLVMPLIALLSLTIALIALLFRSSVSR